MTFKSNINKTAAGLSRLNNFLKAISNINRLRILYFLRDREKCVCEIWQNLKLPQNLVSHHLKDLKNLDLISSKKIGLKVFYKSNQKTIKKYLKDFNTLLKE